jgi:Protein of unknown function (DUF973).
MSVDLKGLSRSLSHDFPTSPDTRKKASGYIMKGSILMLLGAFLVLFFYRAVWTILTVGDGMASQEYSVFSNVEALLESLSLIVFFGLFLYFFGLIYMSRGLKVVSQRRKKTDSLFPVVFLAGIILIIIGVLQAINYQDFYGQPYIGTAFGVVGLLLIIIANVWLISGMIKFGKNAGAPVVGIFSILYIIPFADLIPPFVNFAYAYLLWYSEDQMDSTENKS